MSSMLGNQCIAANKVNAGMPVLKEDSKRSVSPYEFLPTWFFYTPVVLQSIFQGVRHGDMALPLIANPSIHLSGMVGESKNDILNLAGSIAQPWISPFITRIKDKQSVADQTTDAMQAMTEAKLDFPIVAKPDLGCRGVGVKLLKSREQLADYIDAFPIDARFLLQEKAPYQAEAGVFYVRYPGEEQGKIISITLKYAPSVLGDGVSTLQQLIEASPRAGQLSHLYLPRHEDKLSWVPAMGEEFQLAFAGSHSRGSIFKNGNQYITPALTRKLDEILKDVKGYHYGRLDIKFADIQRFMAGEAFTILEINGASSEAAHIWDKNTPLKEIFSTLLMQYRTLFEIGAKQKKLGHKPPTIAALVRAWRHEKALTQQYPSTD
ncbi:D-alanine--D-alanine ligase [Marinomonas transparens]|uniref:D-alanine--D-alanine ligase n=1 Tax=Marinomonas transparens TaxID=2795388 RepID=A0A934N118_9GAMM|nr:D-alanine--D-alanine ligase [Marinomonas transparens]MBJ7536228.1 D-alanine--D-alanine ligase [Marinomonas transparens]